MNATPFSRPSDGPSARAVLRVCLVVVGVGLALYLIYLLRRPITWIVIAGFIALAVATPIGWLSRRIRRGFAIAIVYSVVILTPVLIAAAIVPPLVTETNNLVRQVPGYVTDLQDFVQKNERLRKLEQDYNVTQKLEEEAAKLPGKIGGAAGVLSNIGIGIVNSLFAGITIIILSIFMVGSGGRFIDRTIRSRPAEQQAIMRRATDRIAAAVANYVAGALGQAVVAGVTAWIVLTILGVPYAGALALIMGLLDLVPLVGATLGAVAVAIVTLFNDFPADTIVWVVWSIFYQQIENTVIQPRIQSAAVQVHPFVVLVAVLFGSTLFGVLGALLAIPAAAAIQISIREYRTYQAAVRAGKVQPEPPPPGDLGTAGPDAPTPSPA
jgi:predicted PurR-regulated permease PerM